MNNGKYLKKLLTSESQWEISRDFRVLKWILDTKITTVQFKKIIDSQLNHWILASALNMSCSFCYSWRVLARPKNRLLFISGVTAQLASSSLLPTSRWVTDIWTIHVSPAELPRRSRRWRGSVKLVAILATAVFLFLCNGSFVLSICLSFSVGLVSKVALVFQPWGRSAGVTMWGCADA